MDWTTNQTDPTPFVCTWMDGDHNRVTVRGAELTAEFSLNEMLIVMGAAATLLLYTTGRAEVTCHQSLAWPLRLRRTRVNGSPWLEGVVEPPIYIQRRKA